MDRNRKTWGWCLAPPCYIDCLTRCNSVTKTKEILLAKRIQGYGKLGSSQTESPRGPARRSARYLRETNKYFLSGGGKVERKYLLDHQWRSRKVEFLFNSK